MPCKTQHWRKHPAVIIIGLGVVTSLLCGLLMVEGAMDIAPIMATFSMLVLATCSLLLPRLAVIQPRRQRTLNSLPICWIWGVALMMLLGSFIDCFVAVDPESPIIIPFAIIMLPCGLFGILPALIPYWIIENLAD